NYTRFLILSKDPSNRPSHLPNTKTSLLVRVEDRPGSLYELLGMIQQAGVNLSKIESRPRVGVPWNYDFYLDLNMDAGSGLGRKLVDELERMVSYIKILGTYPQLWP